MATTAMEEERAPLLAFARRRNGYDPDQVQQHIQELLKQHQELQREKEAIEARAAEMANTLEPLQATLAQLSAQIEHQEATIQTLRTELESAREEARLAIQAGEEADQNEERLQAQVAAQSGELAALREEMQRQLFSFEKERDQAAAELSVLRQKAAEADGIRAELEEARRREAAVGSALIDAKALADEIVANARARAEEIVSEAEAETRNLDSRLAAIRNEAKRLAESLRDLSEEAAAVAADARSGEDAAAAGRLPGAWGLGGGTGEEPEAAAYEELSGALGPAAAGNMESGGVDGGRDGAAPAEAQAEPETGGEEA